MKTVLATALFGFLVSGGLATAAELPTSTGECATLVSTIEVALEGKTLSEADATKAEELMLALDKACADSDFAKAQETANQLEQMGS
ncbi:MAG: hypothetical protein GC150_15195 [Rhizobiales bacterium]|nr:hypothetical protein [Hyphomicrobiales bacterium]